MKNIDIFLAFTKCKWMCKFCEKWEELLFLPRQEYDIFSYQRHEVCSSEELYSLYRKKDMQHYNISISWYEPLEFLWLYTYLVYLREIFPNASITLRTSWLENIWQDILEIVDSLEISIYGSTPEIHNSMVWNCIAWNMLNQNIIKIKNLNILYKLHLQTIILRENMEDIPDLIYFMLSFKTWNKLKVVYPYFMPKNKISYLPTKKEVLRKLIISIDANVLKKSICLVNFSSSPILKKIFLYSQI